MMNFSQPGYFMNSIYVAVFSIISAALPVWAIHKIWTNAEKLDDERFRAIYEPLYEDLKTSKKSEALFHSAFMVRRMITVIVFIFLGEYGYYQTATITVLSFINTVTLVHLEPFSNKKTNKVELINEFTVYVCCIIKLCFLNVAYDFDRRCNLANLMIFICLANVFYNLSLVLI